MKPQPYMAKEGRVNPKGIPCLYLATDRDTAIAEVRPWVGSLISVAQFKITRDLRIVDCTHENPRAGVYKDELSPAIGVVWTHIDWAFSQPVTPDDSSTDYVPTQIIAEYFKGKALDGIAYRSGLGNGPTSLCLIWTPRPSSAVHSIG